MGSSRLGWSGCWWPSLIVGLIALTIGSAAHAVYDEPRPRPGTCVLEVQDRLIHAGPCRIAASTGQITVYLPGPRPPFAMVNADASDRSVGEGFWTGLKETSHAHDSLGEMQRFGACWIGRRAKVCAWGATR